MRFGVKIGVPNIFRSRPTVVVRAPPVVIRTSPPPVVVVEERHVGLRAQLAQKQAERDGLSARLAILTAEIGALEAEIG